MKKNSGNKEHPEVTDLKSVCDVSPDTKSTQSVCDKVNKDKKRNPKREK